MIFYYLIFFFELIYYNKIDNKNQKNQIIHQY